MKISKFFDAKIIISGVTATLIAGAALAYLRDKIPFVRTAQRGFDGGRA